MCLQDYAKTHLSLEFCFVSSKELDITDKNNVAHLFNTNTFDYCINCAAYTAVDKAEENKDLAEDVNSKGALNLAEACLENNTTLIHISTDFVFDGCKNNPYTEEDATNPLSVYGKTKLYGEQNIQETLDKFFIFRTSWLYSEYGSNFMKTMLRLGKERTTLSVVADQIGTPTYAKDLAEVLLKLITEDKRCYGVYHYSNKGEISWYDFAKEIFTISETSVILNMITTADYPTAATRPKYSVLSKERIVKELDINLPNWEQSLKRALDNLKAEV